VTHKVKNTQSLKLPESYPPQQDAAQIVATRSPPNASVRTVGPSRRPQPIVSERPGADPLHWWRTRGARSFDDLDLRILVVMLDRYSLTRRDWIGALSGVTADAIDHLSRRRFPSSDRDLLMTCLLRSALAGDVEAGRFLIQALRRHGRHDLASSWRDVRLGPRRIALRRHKTKSHCGRTMRGFNGPKCGNRGRKFPHRVTADRIAQTM